MKDLSLAVTIDIVRQSEEVASQVRRQGAAMGVVHKVTHKHDKTTNLHNKLKEGNNGNRKYEKCGKMCHSKEGNCLARESTAYACNKVGQWSGMCRNKRAVSEVTSVGHQVHQPEEETAEHQ